MKTVAQIISLALPKEVEEAYQRFYDGDFVKHYSKFQQDLAETITVATEPLRIRFDLDQEGNIDVVGVLEGQDARYALDFTPWAEWKAFEVDSDLPLAEQAAHLFEEMTWYGGPENMEAARSRVEDAMESLERDHPEIFIDKP